MKKITLLTFLFFCAIGFSQQTETNLSEVDPSTYAQNQSATQAAVVVNKGVASTEIKKANFVEVQRQVAQEQTRIENETTNTLLSGILTYADQIANRSASQAPVTIVNRQSMVINNSPNMAVTTYTDLATFQGAAGTLVTEDFTGGPGGGVNTCGTVISSAGDACFPAGEIEEGFDVMSGGAPPDDQVVLLDIGFLPGQTIELVGANTFTEFGVVNFTGADPVYEVGMVVYNNSDVDTDYRVFDTGGVLLDMFTLNNAPNTENFFGIISTDAIGFIELEGATASGELFGAFSFTAPGGGGGGTCGGTLANYLNVAPTGDGVPSQDFATANDGFDSQAADDFVVPGTGMASVCEVTITGTYTATGLPGDPTNMAILNIHEDNAGEPGAVIFTESFLGTDVDADGDGIFTLSPTGAPDLMGGSKYWMSVVAQMEFAVSGQFFWSSATDGNDDPFLWQNPLDGFATGCTTWQTSAFCGVGGGLGPDLLMDIAFLEAGGGGSGCAAGVYVDRPSFDAEAGALTFEDFEGGPGGVSACDLVISSAGDSCFAAGEIQVGIEITSNNSAGGNTVYVEAGSFGNVNHAVGSNTFVDYTIINFPNMDVNSFGFDLYGLTAGAPMDIRIFGTGGLIATETATDPDGTGVFFGYIAAETVVSIEIEDLAGAAAELVAQFSFGECVGSGDPVDQIYFTGTQEGQIWSGNKDGTGTPTLIYDTSDGVPTQGPVGIEIDLENGMLYFGGGNDSEIYQAPLDGSGPITAIAGLDECCEHHDLEIDYDAGLVYYTSDNNGLWVGPLDGSGTSTNVVGTVDVKAGVTLDRTNDVLYYVNDLDDDIGIVNTDGTGLDVNHIIADEPRGITLDEANGILYWHEFSIGGVWTAPADGSAAGTLLYPYNFASRGYGIDFNETTGMLTWTEFNNSGSPWEDWVVTAPADGTGTPTVLFDGDFGSVRGIATGRNIRIPTNDECDFAYEIACGDVFVGSTVPDTDSGGNAAPDEFFTFTGTGTTEIVTLSLCDGGTDYDSLLRVFSDCTLANEIAFNDDACGLQSELSFLSDGTSTYVIMVEGFGSNAGNFSLAVTCEAVAANDECADALPIACGGLVAGSTTNATFDAAAPDCGIGITAPGVWYVYEDTTGLVTDITISMCNGNTDYDSKLTVYSGDCGTLVCETDNDDSCGLQSEVMFQSDGASTYYILVHGFGSATGNFELEMFCTPVPPPNDMIANSIDVDEIGFPYTDPAVAMPAATLEAGTPAGCDNAGVLGVWYNFVPEGDGTATASVISPAGFTSVTFYTAPNENAVETDLTLVPYVFNQCVPGDTAEILTVAGQAYYVYVANHGGITDIVIDGTFLGVSDNTIEGFSYYPNPTDSTLNLSSVDNIETVAIYNMLGQKIIDQTVDATSSELNVSKLTTGAYLMKVSVNGQIGTYQILKK